MDRIDFRTGTFYLGDCFDVMATLDAGSVDMVLNDPPYGTTQNKWDALIPFEPMWAAYWRLIKSNGAAVLTGSQPFTSALVMSAVKQFRYCWVWDKVNRITGAPLANKMPMKAHEDVCVFYRSLPVYNKQHRMKPRVVSGRTASKLGGFGGGIERASTKYVKPTKEDDPHNPISIISVPGIEDRVGKRHGNIHPTQKPVALFEYLIRTYTNPGELVLDNTAGSGTTAIAAIQSGRRWICIERDQTYFERAIARVWEAEAAL